MTPLVVCNFAFFHPDAPSLRGNHFETFYCLPWSLCQIQVTVADTLARSKRIVLLIHICMVFIYFHKHIFKTTLKSDPESE